MDDHMIDTNWFCELMAPTPKHLRLPDHLQLFVQKSPHKYHEFSPNILAERIGICILIKGIRNSTAAIFLRLIWAWIFAQHFIVRHNFIQTSFDALIYAKQFSIEIVKFHSIFYYFKTLLCESDRNISRTNLKCL